MNQNHTVRNVLMIILALIVGGVVGFFIAKHGASQTASLYNLPTTQAIATNGGTGSLDEVRHIGSTISGCWISTVGTLNDGGDVSTPRWVSPCPYIVLHNTATGQLIAEPLNNQTTEQLSNQTTINIAPTQCADGTWSGDAGTPCRGHKGLAGSGNPAPNLGPGGVGSTIGCWVVTVNSDGTTSNSRWVVPCPYIKTAPNTGQNAK